MPSSGTRLRAWTCLLLIALSALSLALPACKPRIEPPTIVGDDRIVGKIVGGALQFEPKENPNGDYFIVTQIFVASKFALAIRVRALELECQKLRILLEGKK